MTSSPHLDQTTPDQLRAPAAQLPSKVDTTGRERRRDKTVIEQLSPMQGSVLDDWLNTDPEAIAAELKALRPAPARDESRQKPKRASLPPQFPRNVIRHEPARTQCACGCQLQPLADALCEAVLARREENAPRLCLDLLHDAAPGAEGCSLRLQPCYAGEHPRNVLGTRSGKLVCDDSAGYKASFELGITEIGCMDQARRKFFDLHVTNKSQLTEQSLARCAVLNELR